MQTISYLSKEELNHKEAENQIGEERIRKKIMLNKKQKESRLQKLTAKGRSRTGKSQRSTKNDIRRK